MVVLKDDESGQPTTSFTMNTSNTNIIYIANAKLISSTLKTTIQEAIDIGAIFY
jgi:hypothetical protein